MDQPASTDAGPYLQLPPLARLEGSTKLGQQSGFRRHSAVLSSCWNIAYLLYIGENMQLDSRTLTHVNSRSLIKITE